MRSLEEIKSMNLPPPEPEPEPMTVGRLVDLLGAYPPEMKVIANCCVGECLHIIRDVDTIIIGRVEDYEGVVKPKEKVVRLTHDTARWSYPEGW